MSQDQKQLTRTAKILILYSLFLILFGTALLIWWDVLRQGAGYESIFSSYRIRLRRLPYQVWPALLLASPVVLLLFSLGRPLSGWHEKKRVRLGLVHGLPILLVVLSLLIFGGQYRDLKKERVLYQEKLELQEKIQDIQKEIQEQKQEEESKKLEQISQNLEEAMESSLSEPEKEQEQGD